MVRWSAALEVSGAPEVSEVVEVSGAVEVFELLRCLRCHRPADTSQPALRFGTISARDTTNERCRFPLSVGASECCKLTSENANFAPDCESLSFCRSFSERHSVVAMMAS